ncbi:hypothetical protein HDV01_004351 [Terramyces sp. JEL0728]|nr:hypothetical protein HDV01_004351 [Terramyces sp. JEL0728]
MKLPRVDLYTLVNLQSPSHPFSVQSLSTDTSITYIDAFQVTHPITLPNTPKCSSLLLEHQFPFSYGQPYVGNYTVPTECGSSWDKVVLSLNGSVSGRQFDRVGAIWIDGVEILRLTGAEPSGTPITRWSVEKDITDYSSLFGGLNSVVFAYDNVVDGTYTGIFNFTVSIDFYKGHNDQKPDIVLPLSLSNSSYGWASLPTANLTTFTLPKLPPNLVRAEVEIYVSGHGSDEYTNLPNALAQPQNQLYDGGVYKEIDLFVNGKLVSFEPIPPTVYTGGMNPLLWMPIVGIDTFNLPPINFDITPFASWLFEPKANIGFNVTFAANSYWLVDANLKIWVDKESKQKQFNGKLESFTLAATVPSELYTGDLDNLVMNTTAKNSFAAKGSIKTSKGVVTTKVEKAVAFTNQNLITQQGNNQIFTQSTNVTTTTTVYTKDLTVSKKYKKRYPFAGVLSAITANSYLTTIHHGKHEESDDFILDTALYANGTFGGPSYATTSQNYTFIQGKECYKRNVAAAGRQVVSDVYPRCKQEIINTGVLALQGAFSEHIHTLQKLGVQTKEIKKSEQLNEIDGLIIPGGESTTMSLIMQRNGLIEPLQSFIKSGKPVFGTCAGLIMLSNEITNQKQGGQGNLGGLDITVQRNAFGAQLDSFVSELDLTIGKFQGVFIRAPIITSVGDNVEVIGKYEDRIVAVRQGNILGTSFHPELTLDPMVHEYFIKMI